MHNQISNYDILIIGAELFGFTMAERLVHECNKNVLIINKRDHIGGKIVIQNSIKRPELDVISMAPIFLYLP